jgi:hypothetical protein
MLKREEASVHLAMGGVALLLVLLLLLTPWFLGGVPTSFLSRGTLVVDVTPSGSINLYLDSYDNVRFSSIAMGVNLSAPNLPATTTAWHWDRWYNTTDKVTFNVTLTNLTSFVVNVTAFYQQTMSWGVYGFALAPGTNGGYLTAYPLTSQLPSTASSTWPLSSLPQSLALAYTTGVT